MMLPSVFRLLVKGRILVHILVCALTAAFLDGFLSNFVWRCILVKSTHLLCFGDAAPSVQSFIGSKVIFWWKFSVRSAGHISWWISFHFFTDVHHSQIYTPIGFGDAAPSVPSYGVKGHIWVEMLCALCRPHFLTDLFQILYRCAS